MINLTKKIGFQLVVATVVFIATVEIIIFIFSYQARQKNLYQELMSISSIIKSEQTIDMQQRAFKDYVEKDLDLYKHNTFFLVVFIIFFVTTGVVIIFYLIAGIHIRRLYQLT